MFLLRFFIIIGLIGLIACEHKSLSENSSEDQAKVEIYVGQQRMRAASLAHLIFDSETWAVTNSLLLNQNELSNQQQALNQCQEEVNYSQVYKRRQQHLLSIKPGSDVQFNYAEQLLRKIRSLYSQEMIASRNALERLEIPAQAIVKVLNNLNLFLSTWDNQCKAGVDVGLKDYPDESQLISHFPALYSEVYSETLTLEQKRALRRFSSQNPAPKVPDISSTDARSELEKQMPDNRTIRTEYIAYCSAQLQVIREKSKDLSWLNDTVKATILTTVQQLSQLIKSFNQNYMEILQVQPSSPKEDSYRLAMLTPPSQDLEKVFIQDRDNFIPLLSFNLYQLNASGNSLLAKVESLKSTLQERRKTDIIYANYLENHLLSPLRNFTYLDELQQNSFQIKDLLTDLNNKPELSELKALHLELQKLLWSHSSTLVKDFLMETDQYCAMKQWLTKLNQIQVPPTATNLFRYLQESSKLVISELQINPVFCESDLE